MTDSRLVSGFRGGEPLLRVRGTLEAAGLLDDGSLYIVLKADRGKVYAGFLRVFAGFPVKVEVLRE